ncbi:MAG: hypothetical protein ACRCTY_09555, partial [Candidatus Adiutrix sp.]
MAKTPKNGVRRGKPKTPNKIPPPKLPPWVMSLLALLTALVILLSLVSHQPGDVSVWPKENPLPLDQVSS